MGASLLALAKCIYYEVTKKKLEGKSDFRCCSEKL